MPIITKIKPQRSKKRVNIYLDGKFAFGLDLENYVKLGLKVERELTEKEVEEIVKKGEFQKTLDKLLKFASLRPRSRKEVNMWFRRKKVHLSLTEKLIKKLEYFDLLDDEKFASWWVGQRIRFKNKSKKEIEYELRQKGINTQIIKKVLSGFEINELGNIKKLLEKKENKWKSLKGIEKKQKMWKFLGQKGFGFDNIKKGVEEYLKKG